MIRLNTATLREAYEAGYVAADNGKDSDFDSFAREHDAVVVVRSRHDVIRPEDDPDQLLLFDIDQN